MKEQFSFTEYRSTGLYGSQEKTDVENQDKGLLYTGATECFLGPVLSQESFEKPLNSPEDLAASDFEER